MPYLKDKSIYLAIKLVKNGTKSKADYALAEVPTDFVPRFLVLPEMDGKNYIILLDDVIRFCLEDLPVGVQSVF